MKDVRNAIVISILVLCILIMLFTIVASASYELGVSARAFALYEPVTGTFIKSQNADLHLPMASTTKIMTGLIAIENCSLDEIVEIPKEAVGIEGSSIYLREGDRISVCDLLYSLLLQSANDAATALALKISGDIASFSELMNSRAADMGLTDTHFDNPHGLDSESHYTTAHDLAIIAAEALKNPTFRSITSTYKHSFTISDNQRTVVNHNKLLKSYDGAIGVKTGFTRTSGRCLVSAAERDGLSLIAVTLDAPNDWSDHTKMLNLGFSAYTADNPDDLTDTTFTIPVIGSDAGKITAVIKNIDEIHLIRPKDEPLHKAYVDIKQYVIAPIKPGDKVGEVVFKLDDTVVARADIIATSRASKKNYKHNIFDIF